MLLGSKRFYEVSIKIDKSRVLLLMGSFVAHSGAPTNSSAIAYGGYR